MKIQLKKSFGAVGVSGVTKHNVEYLETRSCAYIYHKIIFKVLYKKMISTLPR